MEHDYKLRSVESNSVDEVHEFDAMEEHEDAFDELDFHNGAYEIKHLAVEHNKGKEEAEKVAIGLLAARLDSLQINLSLIMLQKIIFLFVI